MKLSTPRWWYRRHGAPMALTRFALKPLSLIWTWATARRIARGKPFDPGVPVISVGNVTLGGTGKTPVVRALIQRLAERGVTAAALSRGYGGSLTGPVRVDPALHSARDVGDEPLMMAADARVWVARDRAAGAMGAAMDGAQVIVMDDGHQNPAVKKALSLIVVDGETRDEEWPFGDGAVFPSGPMREPLSAGLARADAVVLVLPEGLAEPDPELVSLFGALPVLVVRVEPAAPPPAGPQVGFAGIAKPWKVERALKAAGCDLKDFAPFADHAELTAGDMAWLRDRAAVFGAGLVTTEKDYARLQPALRQGVCAWPVRARFEDQAALDALLDRWVMSASKHPPS
jgi:tetraacyldisaccharide 4'-kinase